VARAGGGPDVLLFLKTKGFLRLTYHEGNDMWLKCLMVARWGVPRPQPSSCVNYPCPTAVWFVVSPAAQRPNQRPSGVDGLPIWG